MKSQEIHRMEEINIANIEDRKEILLAEQQDSQPLSPKEELVQQSSNDDREFERDHGYQRVREEVTMQQQEEKQIDMADQNEQSHELALLYESDPAERNIRDPYDKTSRYSEKHKNGSKNYNRKRIRSNSIHSEDSYYSRPSEELHMVTTPPPPPPPHPDFVSTPNRPAAIAELKSSLHHHHRLRTPVYDSEIPPPSWHSNNRMPRKDYFNNDRKKNRMRYRNRDFNYERVQLFDRIRIKDRTRIPERERDFEIPDRKERYDRERERELRIIERREITRPRDNPTRYYEESHPRIRVPYYEYGREADRMRAPYYDYHREPEFREREYPRYRELDWEPYYNRPSSPPPGHFPYRDNMKRPNDYFYQPPIYPRRSISPRARYTHNRRSLSPNTRRLSNPTYERRYERDRPPRYDLARDNEFDARRESLHYNAPHYNELHSPGFDHYTSPVIPPSPINMKSSYEDNDINSNVNESYERERPIKSRNWDINVDKDNREGKRGQSSSNDILSGNYEHERERGRGREKRRLWDLNIDDKHKHMEVDNHSNSTIVSTSANTNNNNSTQDRTRDRIRNEKPRNWSSNDDKYRDINADRNNGGGSDATKEPYERHVVREKNNKYWDKSEEKGRDLDRNTTKTRERDNRDNKERGEFDQVFPSKK
jgi:hypothetical protein